MKQKYKVVDILKSKIINTFENKKEAVLFRNEQNDNAQIYSFRIGRGKDHKRGESFPKKSNKIKKKVSNLIGDKN